MTLVKDDLFQSLYNQCGLSKQTSKSLGETIFELIKKALESGDNVLITGFGKFTVRKKAARRGRNPKTGQDLALEPRRVVTFKCSRSLKDRLNSKNTSGTL
jgi:integration host factor subunit alpha